MITNTRFDSVEITNKTGKIGEIGKEKLIVIYSII